jgi:hypothetical protein
MNGKTARFQTAQQKIALSHGKRPAADSIVLESWQAKKSVRETVESSIPVRTHIFAN